MTRVLGIVSGKGGVGKTTLVTNLALALRDFGQKVIIIDCNLSTPHLAYYLGTTDYQYTLNDALLDKVDIISASHNYDGIRYVPASLKLEDLVGIDLLKFKNYLKKLMNPSKVDFIILDSAPGLGREAVAVLDASDEIIFITTPFVPMINDIIRCKGVLQELRGTKTFGIVLNMVTYGKHELPSRAITDVCGTSVITEIPYDKNVIHSLVFKSPVMTYKPDSLASISIMQLAAHLARKEYNPPKKLKLYKLFAKIKNYILPAKFTEQTAEEVKNEIFIQKS